VPAPPATRAFFDSNVLVYAFSRANSVRQAIATELIRQHTETGSLVISVQVLMETYNVLTRKDGRAPSEVMTILDLLATNDVVAPNAAVALMALRLGSQHHLSTWDGLIVQAALEADCNVLYSEDLQASRRFGALHVVNPFVTQAHEAPPLYGDAPPTVRAKTKRAPAKRP
jgi:predicted nucleic acid-binding protein